jgi:hypothetical protein
VNSYIGFIQQRKMHPSSPEKKFGPHTRCLDVAVLIGAVDLLLGADNTTMKLTFGSNL